jgi:GH24 family phage-related lysozyme (muramidase)
VSPRIRVDTETLKKNAEKIDLISADFEKTGTGIYQSTYSLNDYGGQLPTKKSALTAQHDANGIRDQLKEDAEKLKELAIKFEEVDRMTVGGFGLIPEPPLPIDNIKSAMEEIQALAHNALLKTSRCGAQFVARHENYGKDKYYLGPDGAGNLFIGFGHTPKPGEMAEFHKGITYERALELLEEDIATAEQAVREDIHVPLTQTQFDALVDLFYNYSRYYLENKTNLIQLINAGDFEGAAELIKTFHYDSKGNSEPGLVTRRNDDYELFLHGTYGNKLCDKYGQNSPETSGRKKDHLKPPTIPPLPSPPHEKR